MYRSGHNGPDSKSGIQKCIVGSNPTASATKTAPVRVLFLWRKRWFFKNSSRQRREKTSGFRSGQPLRLHIMSRKLKSRRFVFLSAKKELFFNERKSAKKYAEGSRSLAPRETALSHHKKVFTAKRIELLLNPSGANPTVNYNAVLFFVAEAVGKMKCLRGNGKMKQVVIERSAAHFFVMSGKLKPRRFACPSTRQS